MSGTVFAVFPRWKFVWEIRQISMNVVGRVSASSTSPAKGVVVVESTTQS